jgi:hypothetical protein
MFEAHHVFGDDQPSAPLTPEVAGGVFAAMIKGSDLTNDGVKVMVVSQAYMYPPRIIIEVTAATYSAEQFERFREGFMMFMEEEDDDDA